MDCSLCNEILATISNIDAVLLHQNNDWDTLIASARDLIASLGDISFFAGIDDGNRLGPQIQTVEVLQRLAYHDVDAGPVADIANWCLERWLQLHHRHPDNVSISKGLGQWWLSKAQPCLSRIHAIDGSSSSSDGARRRHGSDTASLRSTTDERMAEVTSQISRTSSEEAAELRLHTADYVEARGILLPAVDYFRGAVELATSQNSLTGNLLVTAAEAYMSLGNVSYTRVNQLYFCTAINYLRTASQIPGFPLPAHLQRYLDEFGRFVS